jgi:hypothetical protein
MEKKRRGGWPARTPEPGERVPMSFRVTPAFKERLDRFAARTGRSLAQEIELRLDQSDRGDDQLGQALERVYGRQLAGLLMLLGHVMREVGRSAGFSSTYTLEGAENWMASPYAFGQVTQAAKMIIEAFLPAGDPEPPHYMKGQPFGPDGIDLEQAARNLGIRTAGPYLVAIADPKKAVTADLKRIGTEVREKLGTAAVDRLKR